MLSKIALLYMYVERSVQFIKEIKTSKKNGSKAENYHLCRIADVTSRKC